MTFVFCKQSIRSFAGGRATSKQDGRFHVSIRLIQMLPRIIVRDPRDAGDHASRAVAQL